MTTIQGSIRDRTALGKAVFDFSKKQRFYLSLSFTIAREASDFYYNQ